MWSIIQLFCLAVPLMLILISPTQSLSAATAVCVTHAMMSVPTKPDSVQPNAPNQSNVCIPILDRVTTFNSASAMLLIKALLQSQIKHLKTLF